MRCGTRAKTTQAPILQWLRERGIEHRSFYIVNAVLVKGSREVAEALASRQDVARIEGNPHIQNSLPKPEVLLAARRNRRSRRRLSRTSPTPTRRMCGRWGSEARELHWRRRYWSALDTQRAEASIPRLGWSRGRSQLQLA